MDSALLHPLPEELDGLGGVAVRQVRRFVTGGLKSAIVAGRLGQAV